MEAVIIIIMFLRLENKVLVGDIPQLNLTFNENIINMKLLNIVLSKYIFTFQLLLKDLPSLFVPYLQQELTPIVLNEAIIHDLYLDGTVLH